MTAHTWRHLVLGALCAILGAALWLEVDASREARQRGVAPAPARPRAAAPGSNPVFALPPREAFGDIVARPLFWASRRPIAEASAAAPSDLALLGVLLARDETVAIVRHGKPPRVDRVREGAVLEGWKFVEVALNRVLLERGATRVELKSKDPHPPAPAAPVATAPKPPQPTPPQAAPARSGD